MHAIQRYAITLVALTCWMAADTAYSITNGESVKLNGLITGRSGDTLTLKTSSGKVTVVLTDDTKVQKPKGLGLRKKQMSTTVLIPGLKISVDGVGDAQNRVVAATINFSGDDLQTAETIQAGLTQTQEAVETNQQDTGANKVQIAANRERINANQEQIAANQQEIQEAARRFDQLSEYDVKGQATAYFRTGSSTISTSDKNSLKKLAHEAVNLTGYIIQVKGFADSSGNPAMNQRLSMDRAQAVIAFLLQDCNVPVRHIIAPGAMGTADPAATNETSQGRAGNRRVEVKILVNRGLAGG
ncbi:MAG: OmpA family protein [Acidobacteria bacterium]|nr:MAG: OmpA family protein [Acidobacteriota bacterium]